jgi:hypothetical protein
MIVDQKTGEKTMPKRIVQPDQRKPCPTFVPDGQTEPVAFTKFEIMEKVFAKSWTHGTRETQRLVAQETGHWIHQAHISRALRNPFYAGRPASRTYADGEKRIRRDDPVFTIGTYETVLSYEDWLVLQQIIAQRAQTGEKSGRVLDNAWATRILRCQCGQVFISSSKDHYTCVGTNRQTKARAAAKRQSTLSGADTSGLYDLTPVGSRRRPAV